MKKIFTLLLLSSAWFSGAQTNFNPGDWGADLTGYWTFEDGANLGKATIGTDMVFDNTPQPFTQAAGPNASDKAIFSNFPGNSLITTTGIGANGGGAKSNQYTIMMDIMVPALVAYNCLLNTENTLGTVTTDGELFLSDATMGSGSTFGYYTDGGNPLVINTWYRIVLTGDMTAAPGVQNILYRDGVEFMVDDTNRGNVIDDDRQSFGPVINILGDEDGENGDISVGQVAIFNRALTDVEVAQLGGTVLATSKFSAANNTLKVYPNPVGSNARISFNMPSASKNTNIELIDMSGRVVESIFRGSLDQGEQTISWDLKSKYNAGTYLVKLSSENTNQVYSILMK